MIKKIIISCILFLTYSFSYASIYFNSPEDFMPNHEADWRVLEAQIMTTKDKDIYIYWEGYGGRLDIMADFVNVLQEAYTQGKTVTFVMTGDAYSAQAVSACYATRIEGNDIYFLMFHPVADTNDKVLTDPETIHDAKVLEQPCIDKGILTPDAQNRSLTYQEVYVYYRNGQYIRYYKLDRRL